MTLYLSISGAGKLSSSRGVRETAADWECNVGGFLGSRSPRKKVPRHGLGEGVVLSHGERIKRVKEVLTEPRDSHRGGTWASDGVRE